MDILDIRIYNDISKNDVNAMKDKEKVMLKGVQVTKRHEAHNEKVGPPRNPRISAQSELS